MDIANKHFFLYEQTISCSNARNNCVMNWKDSKNILYTLSIIIVSSKSESSFCNFK